VAGCGRSESRSHPFHDLAVRQLDVHRRLEPSHTSRQSEVMKRRCVALAASAEQILSGSDPSTTITYYHRTTRHSVQAAAADVREQPAVYQGSSVHPPRYARCNRTVLVE
jgi:hypothetical protein